MALSQSERESWPHFFHIFADVHDYRPDSPLARLRYLTPSPEEFGHVDVAALGVLSDGTLIEVASYERTHDAPSMAGDYSLATVHEERGKPSPPPPLSLLLADLDLVDAVVHSADGPRGLYIELRRPTEG